MNLRNFLKTLGVATTGAVVPLAPSLPTPKQKETQSQTPPPDEYGIANDAVGHERLLVAWWSRYYANPEVLDFGGYIQHPFMGGFPQMVDQGEFHEWKRSADTVEHIDGWFVVTRRWVGIAGGRWKLREKLFQVRS